MKQPKDKYDWIFSQIRRLPYGAGEGKPFYSDQEAYASGYVEASAEALVMLDKLLVQPLTVAQREALEQVRQDIENDAWGMNQELARCNVFGDRGPES